MSDSRGKAEALSTALPFWGRLRESQRESLISNTRSVRYKKGSRLADVGEDCGVMIVRRGRICASGVSEQGREVALMTCRTGDICLLAAHSVMDTTAFNICVVAETEVNVLIISSRALEDVCKSCVHAESFMRRLVSQHFCSVVGNMQSMLLNSPEQRLAAYLCDFTDRTGSSRVSITHEQLAKHIGTAREVVSRTLKRLSNSGIVASERGAIIILDRARLRALRRD